MPQKPFDSVAYMKTLHRKVRTLWAKACAHDGIDPAAKFVTWSDDNPYEKAYNAAMAKLQGAVRCGVEGGYLKLRRFAIDQGDYKPDRKKQVKV